MSVNFHNNSVTFVEGPLAGKIFHPLWLRERLNDKKNLDPINLQRLYEPSLIDISINIKEFSYDEINLTIKFSDEEVGIFLIKDLLNEVDQHNILPDKKQWEDNILKKSYHNYKILNNSLELTIDMLRNFHLFGFVILTHMSKKEGAVIDFAETLGPVRSTNFGKYFDVISKPNPDDLAYTALGLSPHTDNPYRKPVPGIQLLHCIVNDAEGGNSTLVDGLKIANYLKKNEKHYFDILTSVEVLFHFADKEVVLQNWGRLIELDSNNNFKQIRFSGRLDYVPAINPEKLVIFYQARKRLYELCISKDFMVSFRLESGMLAMFDNHRLLHGRTKYDPSSGNRHLQGCYIEHDVVEGKLRKYLSK